MDQSRYRFRPVIQQNSGDALPNVVRAAPKAPIDPPVPLETEPGSSASSHCRCHLDSHSPQANAPIDPPVQLVTEPGSSARNHFGPDFNSHSPQANAPIDPPVPLATEPDPAEGPRPNQPDYVKLSITIIVAVCTIPFLCAAFIVSPITVFLWPTFASLLITFLRVYLLEGLKNAGVDDTKCAWVVASMVPIYLVLYSFVAWAFHDSYKKNIATEYSYAGKLTFIFITIAIFLFSLYDLLAKGVYPRRLELKESYDKLKEQWHAGRNLRNLMIS